MITIEKCKKILLDNGEDYSDEEVAKIRDFLYKGAKIIKEVKAADDSKIGNNGKNKKL